MVDTMSAVPVPVSFTASDGYALAGAWYPSPPAVTPRAAVLINSATGVPKEIYAKFAAHLASHGYPTFIHDYRGIGASKHGSLRGLEARMQDWVRLDISAALAQVVARAGDLPLLVIGHSIGGQLLPLVEGIERARAVLTIATSTGSWRKMSGTYRWLCAGLWYGFMPLTTALLGYAPSKLLGLGEDLPRGVAREWGGWCRSDRYFGDGLDPDTLATLARFQKPWLSLSFTDDPIANTRTVSDLHAFFPGSRIESVFVSPREVGLPSLGHFGFFSSRSKEALWARPLAYFEAVLAT